MKLNHLYPALTLAILAVTFSCNKEDITTNNAAANSASIDAVVNNCNAFTYPDSIFYPKPQATNYIVKPVTALTGTFGAFPAGLRINPTTGNINVTLSETGLEYIVWFVATGSTDTCKKFITISGVNYKDSIYVMANNSALSKPIYNANTSLPVDCSSGCEFDDGPDDDNGNGTADEPLAGEELTPQGFVINKTTGVINFKKSIQNGVLGVNPVSGTSKEFTLNYRLGDKSKKALNHISFELFFYKTKAEIPAKLLDDLSIKQSQVLLEDEEDDDHGGGHGGHGGGHGSNLTTINLSASSATTAKKGAETKCRPPYIIVTQK